MAGTSVRHYFRSTFLPIVCVMTIASLFGCCDAQSKTVGRPPMIIEQAETEMSYKVSEKVEIPCVASGDPSPSYRWQKNGQPLNVNGIGLKQLVGRGTLVLVVDEATSVHDGVYQCFASNDLGTTVSIKTVLRRAMLDPFPTLRESRLSRPAVGTSLSLRCTAPSCYPAGNVYWGENKNGPKLRPIETTSRISLDYEGGLHFSNVETKDSLDGVHYVCVVHNAVLRNLVQGDDHIIQPFQVTETPKYEPPAIMWSSPTNDIAIKGQVKKMKCIFSGFPTPNVTWSRLDAPMPSKNSNTSFGQELTIDTADFSDSGRYQCTAVNTKSRLPVAIKDFSLSVESPPFWRNDRLPQSVDASEEDDVIFECNVNGRPKPLVTWYINGVPLEAARPDPRRTLSSGGTTLRLHNVTKSDTMVLQCNASNSHGYIFANAYLNVRAEAPSFLETPKTSLKVAEGQTAVLTCKVYGAPKPTIIWQKGELLLDVAELRSSRISVLQSGDLEIRNAVLEDADMYQCYTFNKFGSDSASGKLVVINRTQIVEPPTAQNVTSPADVTLTCSATTDARETTSLRIDWLKDDVELEPAASGGGAGGGGGRLEMTDGGRRLRVRGSRVNDTGLYTCRASNGVDSDVASVVVIVRDRPEPPTHVRIARCAAGSAEITWSPAADNNDPIAGYVVYVNASHDDVTTPPRFAVRVSGLLRSASVRPLAPWTSYSFRVAAVNDVGESRTTLAVGPTCRTPSARPHRSPRRVCTDSRGPRQLVVVWEPMLPIEHHGDGFHYVVMYRRLADSQTALRHVNVADWRQSELVVDGVETYEQYEVAVQAVNSLGPAPEASVEHRLGYSGQDVPLVVPANLRYDSTSVNSTSALFTWDSVDTSVSSIQGFFRGYQIQYWKSDRPSVIRTFDFIHHQWEPCRPLGVQDGHVRTAAESSSPRSRRSPSVEIKMPPVSGLVTSLWPFSSVTAGVRVLNGAKAGSLSPTITFMTTEGVPDIVPMFWVSERGSHHLKLSWTAPFDVNGVLTGYIISYKEATAPEDGANSPRVTMITDPQQTYKKIFDLRDDTVYILTIWALTAAGRGAEKVISEVTVPSSEPDRPVISNVDTGYDFLNVSWRPSAEQPGINPASEFLVEYQLEEAEEWEKSVVEREHNWINVSGLIHGSMYRIRVAAIDRHGDMMKSDAIEVAVGIQPASVREEVSSANVSIIVVCVLVALVVLAILAFFVHRRRHSGRYPVHEKEKRHGASGGNLYDEAPFGEYVRTDDSLKKKSIRSLESSSKSEEDATDSLGIYEDVDPIKFTDDGSFAEHVGGYKKMDELPDADMTNTSALSSLV